MEKEILEGVSQAHLEGVSQAHMEDSGEGGK